MIKLKFLLICLLSFGIEVLHGRVNGEDRKQQTQPPSYRDPLSKKPASINDFKALESGALIYNQQIPAVSSGTYRVATYNIHYLTGMGTKSKIGNELVKVIRNVDPTIIVLQEVPINGKDASRPQFIQDLKAAGFVYHYEAVGTRSWLSNMVFSKVPFTYTHTLDLNSKRAAAVVTFQVTADGNTFDIDLIGTHLEVKDQATRISEAKQLLAAVNNPRTIIVGDFNDYINSTPLTTLTSSGFSESFHALNWNSPNYTCWAGTTIDHVLVRSTMASEILGAYVYHSKDASDHLPVIVDFSIPTKQLNQDSNQPASTKWSHIVGIILALITIGSVVLLLVWHARRRRNFN